MVARNRQAHRLYRPVILALLKLRCAILDGEVVPSWPVTARRELDADEVDIAAMEQVEIMAVRTSRKQPGRARAAQTRERHHGRFAHAA